MPLFALVLQVLTLAAASAPTPHLRGSGQPMEARCCFNGCGDELSCVIANCTTEERCLSPQLNGGCDSPLPRSEGGKPRWCPISTSRPLASRRASNSDHSKWSTIRIAGGVSSNLTYLSATPDGSSVGLHDVDEKNGLQRWVLTKGGDHGSGAWYYILVFDGVSNARAYLSSTPDGSNVHLHDRDEGSGRQRWTLTKGSGDWFSIKVLGGISSSRVFLSSTPDGSNVNLHDRDEGSGRQRWRIDSWSTIRIGGGVSSNGEYLSATPDGADVDLHYVDQGSGRQRWILKEGGSLGSGRWYNILVLDGVPGIHTYLSSTPDGSDIHLHDVDEGSGRQRWALKKGGGDWFNIKVFGGVSSNCSFLSSTPDGLNVDLHDVDDGSGRQHWKIDFGNICIGSTKPLVCA